VIQNSRSPLFTKALIMKRKLKHKNDK
jgi:hypothetical protein